MAVGGNHSSCESSGSSSPHIDPVSQPQFFEGQPEKHDSIKYERNNDNIEHGSHKERQERKEHHQLTVVREVINEHAAQGGNGLGANNGNQPDSINAAPKGWFFRSDCKKGEYGVDQDQPENETESEENNSRPDVLPKDDELTASDACCGDYGKVSDRTTVIFHIGKEPVWKEDDAPHGKQQQTDKENDIQPE